MKDIIRYIGAPLLISREISDAPVIFIRARSVISRLNSTLRIRASLYISFNYTAERGLLQRRDARKLRRTWACNYYIYIYVRVYQRSRISVYALSQVWLRKESLAPSTGFKLSKRSLRAFDTKKLFSRRNEMSLHQPSWGISFFVLLNTEDACERLQNLSVI